MIILTNIKLYILSECPGVAQWVRHCATSRKDPGSTPGIYSVEADISVCPGVDSASKNEYQDIPGGKGARCVSVTTLPPSCAECLVIWSLNRPEPSGRHKPVIGVALPSLHFVRHNSIIYT